MGQTIVSSLTSSYEKDPRIIIRKQIRDLADQFNKKYMCSPPIEFSVFPPARVTIYCSLIDRAMIITAPAFDLQIYISYAAGSQRINFIGAYIMSEKYYRCLGDLWKYTKPMKEIWGLGANSQLNLDEFSNTQLYRTV